MLSESHTVVDQPKARSARLTSAVAFLRALSQRIRHHRGSIADDVPTSVELLLGGLVFRLADGIKPPDLTLRTLAWRYAQTTRIALNARINAADLIRAPLLWVPRHTNHLKDMIPVAQRLRERGTVPGLFVVFGRSLAAPIVAAGLPTLDCAPYGRGSRSRLGDERRALEAACGESLEEAGVTEPVEWADFRLRVRDLVEETLEPVVMFAEAFEALVRVMRPRCVVVGNPTLAEGRAAVWAARGVGASTISIQHGDLIGHDFAWSDAYVDYFCSWGTHGATELQVLSPRTMATHVTGAPWLDGDRQRRLAGAAIRREILVALSGPGHSVSLPEHLSCLDRLAEAAKKLPDVTWRIRLHSKDDPTFYRPRFPDRVIFNLPSKDRLPIDADLESAGILITAGSTSGIDALRMGVPVVTVEGPPTFVVPPYVKAGTTTHVGRGQDLTEALRALLANSARADVQERAERWVAHFYGPADGHAADRIAQVIRPLFVS